MNPGAITRPAASISTLPCNERAEIAAILLPLMATLRTASSPDSGSITRPCWRTMSYVCEDRSEGNNQRRHRIRVVYLGPADSGHGRQPCRRARYTLNGARGHAQIG